MFVLSRNVVLETARVAVMKGKEEQVAESRTVAPEKPFMKRATFESRGGSRGMRGFMPDRLCAFRRKVFQMMLDWVGNDPGIVWKEDPRVPRKVIELRVLGKESSDFFIETEEPMTAAVLETVAVRLLRRQRWNGFSLAIDIVRTTDPARIRVPRLE